MNFNAHDAKIELVRMMNVGMLTTEEMSNAWNIVDDAEADVSATSYTFAAIQANGAVILRSSIAQDRTASAKAMLDAIRTKCPTAEHCISFRTFDGDTIIQFKIEYGSGALPKCGIDHTF